MGARRRIAQWRVHQAANAQDCAVGNRAAHRRTALRIETAPPDVLPYPDQEGTYFYCSPHRPARLTMVQILVGGDIGLIYRSRGDTVTIGREMNDVNFPEDPFISDAMRRLWRSRTDAFRSRTWAAKRHLRKVPRMVQLASGDQAVLGQQLCAWKWAD